MKENAVYMLLFKYTITRILEIKHSYKKDLSLIEFIGSYGTEEQCFEVLYKWRWGNGFKCP